MATRRTLTMRARTALLAAATMTIALTAAIAVLVVTLRGALVEEVDRSIDARAQDIFEQLQFEEVFLGPAWDIGTMAAIVGRDGFVETTTDESLMGAQLVNRLDPVEEAFDLELDLAYTDGADNLRAVAAWADFEPFGPETLDSFTDMGDVGPEDSIVVVATSLDAVDRTVRRTLWGAIAIAPVLVALVAWLTWLLTGRALRPVEAIRREVEEISAQDLHRRVPEPATRDEIGRLATTMNGMLGRVERAHAAQLRFVGDASHELRSPLASMRTQIDVARRHDHMTTPHTTTRDPHRSTLDGLSVEVDRMQRLVDDLLLLAKSDARQPAQPLGMARRRLVDLDDIVLDVVRRVDATNGSGPSTPTFDVSAVSAGLVSGSADQLRRLCTNLVENAVRHARSRIIVGVRERNGEVLLTVADDGPGVPPGERERIFERFVRVDDARSRDAGGSGLGLAICAEIAQAHGGSIDVEDADSGGARFVVRLPSPEDPQVPAAVDAPPHEGRRPESADG